MALPAVAAQHILAVEGGFVSNKADPGGATNFGITQRTLTSARKTIACLLEDVKDLTEEQALTIFEFLYWKPAGCCKLQSPIDLVVFDGAVNCGTRQGVKFLQEALNVFDCGLAVDGVIGKKTLAALSSVRNAHTLCAVVLWVRALYYLSLANSKPTMRAFLRGWLNRLAHLWERCC